MRVSKVACIIQSLWLTGKASNLLTEEVRRKNYPCKTLENTGSWDQAASHTDGRLGRSRGHWAQRQYLLSSTLRRPPRHRGLTQDRSSMSPGGVHYWGGRELQDQLSTPLIAATRFTCSQRRTSGHPPLRPPRRVRTICTHRISPLLVTSWDRPRHRHPSPGWYGTGRGPGKTALLAPIEMQGRNPHIYGILA